MNYETASDFEINKAVAEALYGPDSIHADGCGERFLHVINDHGMWSPDYCNNPADAWPLITANGISLYSPESTGMKDFWLAEKFYPKVDGEKVGWFDKNPLRAVAVVFLKMQESATE